MLKEFVNRQEKEEKLKSTVFTKWTSMDEKVRNLVQINQDFIKRAYDRMQLVDEVLHKKQL